MIAESFLNAVAAATATTEATAIDDNDQAAQWDGELYVVEEPQEDDIRTLEMHDTDETDSSDSDNDDDDAEGVSGPEYPDSEADGSDSDTDTSESDSDAENEPAATAAPGGPLTGTPPWSVAAVRTPLAWGPRLGSRWGGGGGGGGGGRGVWASAASKGAAAITTNDRGDGASVCTERDEPPPAAGAAPDATDVDLQMDDAAAFLLMERAASALDEARTMAVECGAAMEASSLRRAAAEAAAFAPGDAVAVAVDPAPDADPAVRETSSPSASTSTTDCGGNGRKEELVQRLQAVVGDYVAAMVPRVDAARATEAALAAQAATHREEVARLTAALRRASKAADQESRKAAAAQKVAREAREELRDVYARLAGIVPASACAAAASTAAAAARVK